MCAVLSCSVASDSETSWTVAHQAPLSIGILHLETDLFPLMPAQVSVKVSVKAWWCRNSPNDFLSFLSRSPSSFRGTGEEETSSSLLSHPLQDTKPWPLGTETGAEEAPSCPAPQLKPQDRAGRGTWHLEPYCPCPHPVWNQSCSILRDREKP